MARPKQQTDREILDRLLKLVEQLLQHPYQKDPSRVYDNKAIMELLQIKHRYLKKLRDDGYLAYSRHGDKYWYTQEDVDRFLKKFHYADFANGDICN